MPLHAISVRCHSSVCCSFLLQLQSQHTGIRRSSMYNTLVICSASKQYILKCIIIWNAYYNAFWIHYNNNTFYSQSLQIRFHLSCKAWDLDPVIYNCCILLLQHKKLRAIACIRYFDELMSTSGAVNTFWPTLVLTDRQLTLSTGPKLDICLWKYSSKYQHLSLPNGKMPFSGHILVAGYVDGYPL